IENLWSTNGEEIQREHGGVVIHQKKELIMDDVEKTYNLNKPSGLVSCFNPRIDPSIPEVALEINIK
nr:hypothetical protein [Tanacetum cinerariifolium]